MATQQGLTREQLENFGARRPQAKTFQQLKQEGAQPLQLAKTEDDEQRGFFESLLKRPLERLVLEPGRRTGEAIASLASAPFLTEEQKKRGQKGVQKDKTIDVPVLGEFKTRGLKDEDTTKQILGETLETASWLVPPAKAGKVVGAGLKGVGKAAFAGAGVGATTGALGGSGVALQEGESAVGGAVSGAAAGGILGALGGALPAAVPAFRRARIEKTAKEADRLSQTITQGKTKDLPTIQRRVRDIETEGINNYDDLVRGFNDKISVLAQKVDGITDSRSTPINLDNWTSKTKVGNKTVKQNFVSDSLDHLEEVFRKTNQAPEAERIVQLRNKAETIGLTPTEANQIAREYGIEFGQRAFSKTGEPLTSVNAVSFENTRKGLKNTIREFVNDPAFAETDKAISDFIRLRDLSKRVQEKANQLKGRTTKRGIGEKVGRGLFQLVDFLSFRSAGGFVRAIMPRGAGFKVLNAIDIEKNLQKNIKKLQKIVDAKDDKTMLDAVSDALEDFMRRASQ